MDRTPQHQPSPRLRRAGQQGRSRRLITGVTLVAATAAVMVMSQPTSARHGRADAVMFANTHGTLRTIGMDGADTDNPFFQPLGTNGRTCETCHRPAQGWNITPAELRDRF